ncbi:MAG: glycosyltransferase [Bacteroides sp.]|nr:glycosyltransferase [Bacteroides sp.]
MKCLFIVQGEGRGHLTQAISMEEELRRNGHEVVEILVGRSSFRQLPAFFVQAVHAPIGHFLSPNFLPAPANGRVNLWRSVCYNLKHLAAYAGSLAYLNRRIRESGAEVVVNFYELLTGLTYLLYRPSVPQVCIGHQYLFLHRDFEFPSHGRFSLLMLRLFTRLTCLGARERLALSFREMADDSKRRVRVLPPLLRKEVFACKATGGDYLHGYMVNAGFGESVRAWHEAHRDVPLHFFWDKQGAAEETSVDETLCFHQIDDVKFLRYMAGCRAYATTAGFESVCEAMYLGKPLLMVPVHIEQDCNAHDAVRTGAGITDCTFNLQRLLAFADGYRPDSRFRQWAESGVGRVRQCIERVAKAPSAGYPCCSDRLPVPPSVSSIPVRTPVHGLS